MIKTILTLCLVALLGVTEHPATLNRPRIFIATAYSLRGRTASGRLAGPGIVAADLRVLPIGTRIHVTSKHFNGDLTVADTGGAIKYRRLDIWLPHAQAKKFGRRKVLVVKL